MKKKRTSKPSAAESALHRRIDAAMGRIPCDLQIKDVEYLDVFSCEWKTGDISLIDGVIVGVESGLKAHRVLSAKGRKVVPGFIDAHVHVESSLLIPANFDRMVLPKGTTTAICDPHELTNVMGLKGLQYFLDSAERLNVDLRVMLSSCVPATHLETNGGGQVDASDLWPLRKHPKALGLAEMMNMRGVIHKDPGVVAKLAKFENDTIDGHAPLMSGHELSAYVAAGVSSCHESTRLGEAAEKLSKGMSVWIREGSVAKDLKALIPLLNMARSPSIGFCTDDRNPLDIVREGHVDYLVRKSIEYGVIPEVAFRSASLSVARHYGLKKKGAIAPGYEADLVILSDVATCEIEGVIRAGQIVAELDWASSQLAKQPNTIRAKIPTAHAFEAESGQVHVIGVEAGKILTQRLVASSDEAGVARISVLERYGKGGKPSNAYVRGFGARLDGAIASSVGHDSHNLIVVGKKSEDMRIALAALAASGGGFCVVKDGAVVSQLELPFGGLMCAKDPKEVEATLRDLHQASRAVNCELEEPFLQLAFLSLPVIPSLKITDKGLVDVEAFQFINVRAS